MWLSSPCLHLSSKTLLGLIPTLEAVPHPAEEARLISLCSRGIPGPKQASFQNDSSDEWPVDQKLGHKEFILDCRLPVKFQRSSKEDAVFMNVNRSQTFPATPTSTSSFSPSPLSLSHTLCSQGLLDFRWLCIRINPPTAENIVMTKRV